MQDLVQGSAQLSAEDLVSMARLLPYDLFLFNPGRELIWQSKPDSVIPLSPVCRRLNPANVSLARAC